MADPLAQLRDIRLPADPSWWPPAPGWWSLALMAAIILGVAVRVAWRAWQAGRPAREVRRRLVDIESSPLIRRDPAAARALSILLRRYLLARFGAEQVAGLQGHAFAAFLDERCPGLPVTGVELEQLLQSPYRRDGGDVAAFCAVVRAVVDATAGAPAQRAAWRFLPRAGG